LLFSLLAQAGNLSEAEEPDGHPLHEKTTFDPLFLNATVEDDDDLLVAEFNTTEHKGFLHGFVESLSVILVSELGDKTFFIAAILAMRNNKLTVFLVRLERSCYITVDSATTALQNGACTFQCILKQMHYKTPFSH
jgi:hypothetical protein